MATVNQLQQHYLKENMNTIMKTVQCPHHSICNAHAALLPSQHSNYKFSLKNLVKTYTTASLTLPFLVEIS